MSKIKKEYTAIVNRFNKVMKRICCEHLIVDPNESLSEIFNAREAYLVEDGVTIGWMKYQAEYWLECYTEEGNCRYEDRLIDKYEYRRWVNERGCLKRLIAALEDYDDVDVVEEM